MEKSFLFIKHLIFKYQILDIKQANGCKKKLQNI